MKRCIRILKNSNRKKVVIKMENPNLKVRYNAPTLIVYLKK
ncbi:hypothetical protein CLPUN_53370 [Clostridium puniceum]|uniref:Uncharacterized protein n=1 Tax=Clostridium puniceum TaxID=29367 RepID=A0A1S8SXL2_9CLOT|nr:hypothetical protein CLPUN_53370 [Clostridium puniceum]